jgi:subtilisin family serine protease
VISVGASGQDDARASFSNYGAGLDLVAPGVEILSLRARRTDVAWVAGLRDYVPGSRFVGKGARYYRVSGTSFAAPFVTGAASLLLSKDPSLDAAAVRRVLLQSARDVGPPGTDAETGYGRLDLRAALAADPAFFVEARIENVAVARRGDEPVVQVDGTLDANAFAGGRIELGAGASPSEWRSVAAHSTPVRAGRLAEIPAAEFRGEKTWILRAVARHRDGREREYRHGLSLGR